MTNKALTSFFQNDDERASIVMLNFTNIMAIPNITFSFLQHNADYVAKENKEQICFCRILIAI